MPSPLDSLLLYDEEPFDSGAPATGDQLWATWHLEPGAWTVTLDAGDGDPLQKTIEVAPGPGSELTFP